MRAEFPSTEWALESLQNTTAPASMCASVAYSYFGQCFKLCCITINWNSDLTLVGGLQKYLGSEWGFLLYLYLLSYQNYFYPLITKSSRAALRDYLVALSVPTHGMRSTGCLHLLGPTQNLGVELVTYPLSSSRSSLS